MIEQSLREHNIPEHKISDAVRPFDQSLSVGEYFNSTTNAHVVQAKGFSSFKSLQACYDDAKNSAETKKTKKVELVLNARFILSTVKAYDLLLLDGTRAAFIKALRDFIAPVPASFGSKEASYPVLSAIRENCRYSANLYLTSVESPVTSSLENLSRMEDKSCQKRDIPLLQLDKVLKICKTSKSEINLLLTENAPHICFSCFHCPSSVVMDVSKPKKARNPAASVSVSGDNGDDGDDDDDDDDDGGDDGDDDDDDDGDSFQPTHHVNDLFKYFNVNKALPLESYADIKRHVDTVHRKGEPFAITKAGEHSHLFLCRFCTVDSSLTPYSFICCQSHFFDHHRSLHLQHLPHLRTLQTLQKSFGDDSTLNAILEEALLVCCHFCGHLSSSKTARDAHMHVCQCRHLTLSNYFAEPLSASVFRSAYSQEKAKESVLEHLTTQISVVADRVRLTTHLQPEKVTEALGKLSAVDSNSFRRILEEETSEDFVLNPKYDALPSQQPSRPTPVPVTSSALSTESSPVVSVPPSSPNISVPDSSTTPKPSLPHSNIFPATESDDVNRQTTASSPAHTCNVEPTLLTNQEKQKRRKNPLKAIDQNVKVQHMSSVAAVYPSSASVSARENAPASTVLASASSLQPRKKKAKGKLCTANPNVTVPHDIQPSAAKSKAGQVNTSGLNSIPSEKSASSLKPKPKKTKEQLQTANPSTSSSLSLETSTSSIQSRKKDKKQSLQTTNSILTVQCMPSKAPARLPSSKNREKGLPHSTFPTASTPTVAHAVASTSTPILAPNVALKPVFPSKAAKKEGLLRHFPSTSIRQHKVDFEKLPPKSNSSTSRKHRKSVHIISDEEPGASFSNVSTSEAEDDEICPTGPTKPAQARTKEAISSNTTDENNNDGVSNESQGINEQTEGEEGEEEEQEQEQDNKDEKDKDEGNEDEGNNKEDGGEDEEEHNEDKEDEEEEEEEEDEEEKEEDE